MMFANLARASAPWFAGVKLSGDVFERLSEFGLGGRWMMSSGMRRRTALIRRRGVLFIHVPKNAGTSICDALYGLQLGHRTLRYYEVFEPGLIDSVDSFSVLRDPADRFLSAYSFVRRGGTSDVSIDPRFRATLAPLKTIDDAIAYAEENMRHAFYNLDNPFRPQIWFLRRRSGKLGVKKLLLIDDRESLRDHLSSLGVTGLKFLNASGPSHATLSARHREKLRRLYADDYALIESLRQRA